MKNLIITILVFVGSLSHATEHLNGVAKVSDPKNWDVYRLHLAQVNNGYAIFKDLNGFQSLVAVDMHSLDRVAKGIGLHHLSEFAKDGASCLKFIAETTGTDNEGFPAKVSVFTAVKCH